MEILPWYVYFWFPCWQIYERGVGMFKWPNVYDIWNTYLTKFLERYVSDDCAASLSKLCCLACNHAMHVYVIVV